MSSAEYQKAWRLANSEAFAASQKKYREANLEKLRERSRARHAANPDYMRDAQRRHMAKPGNKEKAKAYCEAKEVEVPGYRRNLFLKRRYGISLDEYKMMLLSQGGMCAICRNPETTVHKSGTPHTLNVDHCHETGRVRGLLCSLCNTAIGKMHDDPSRLRAAAMYLESANYGA